MPRTQTGERLWAFVSVGQPIMVRRAMTPTEPMAAAAGRVMIHASAIGFMSFQFAERLTRPTPMIAPMRMCAVIYDKLHKITKNFE